MEINLYDVIKRPLLSEKAQNVNQRLGKLVLQVHPMANKSLVKDAIKKLFNVEVAKVNLQIRKGKNKRLLRTKLTVKGSDKKIAIITLKKGYSLDLFGHGEQSGVKTDKGSQESKKSK